MALYSVRFTQLPDVRFSALERLSLQHYRCTILDLDTMVARCPRLRVLKVNADRSAQVVTICSTSLQELELSIDEGQCEGIDIGTPLLTQLKLSVDAASDINVSIWAPMVEKVVWKRYFSETSLLFGFWYLASMDLGPADSFTDVPSVHVLSLDISVIVCLLSVLPNVLNLYPFMVLFVLYAS